ncbi:glycosyltransferase, partial [Candidatus Thioglobus sp.]|nr:glycosyltransferase [Candidatus Thioglobus sp.]
LEKITQSMELHLNDKNVEALVFDFKHFYGNAVSMLNSPGWYRSEARIIKNSVRTYAPDGLFWVVLDSNKIGRYPKAKHTGATCYHYGWVRSEEQMRLKSSKVQKYWGGKTVTINYSQMDQGIIQEFLGTHPKIIRDWLPRDEKVFRASSKYKLTSKQKKHRLMIKLEKYFGLELSKKHYKLI